MLSAIETHRLNLRDVARMQRAIDAGRWGDARALIEVISDRKYPAYDTPCLCSACLRVRDYGPGDESEIPSIAGLHKILNRPPKRERPWAPNPRVIAWMRRAFR